MSVDWINDVLGDLDRAISRTAESSALADTFDEIPLPLDEWMNSPDHMNLSEEPLSPIQFDVLRHAEQIYFPETYHLLAQTQSLKWRPRRFVNFVWMMVGKGGGKDRVAALAQLRIVYLLLCLRRPQRYMKIGSTSNIHLLNTASSDGQAEQIFFAELKGLLGHAPWFRDRYNGVSKEIAYDKNVVALSGNSKEESQEGMNLLFGCLDEIDAFRTKEEREKTARTSRGAMLNAEGIFDMMRTSGGSRFPFNFKVMGLSWPRYVGSFIHTKHREGFQALVDGTPGRTYVVPRLNGATTWESNPTKSLEDYAADFEENPELARAKYMCLPPESEAPFFRNRASLDAAFQPLPEGKGEPLEIEYYWGHPVDLEHEEGPLGYRLDSGAVAPPEAWQVHLRFRDDFVCRDSFPRGIHVDTGIVSDRCGFAMSHVRGFTTLLQNRLNEDGDTEQVVVRRPLITTDLITYFEAPKDQEHGHGEVELRWVRRLIWELVARGFPIALVTFDGYQSTDSLQLLAARGIETDRFSLDRSMEGYDTAKSITYQGGLECYAHPLLMKELRALTVVMGKKVDHPAGGSKDLADAWAGSINAALRVGEFAASSTEDFIYSGKGEWGDELRGIDPDPTSAVLAGLPANLDGFDGPPRGYS